MDEKTEQTPEPMTLTVLRNRMKDLCGRINDGVYGKDVTDDHVWACIYMLDEYEATLPPPTGDATKFNIAASALHQHVAEALDGEDQRVAQSLITEMRQEAANLQSPRPTGDVAALFAEADRLDVCGPDDKCCIAECTVDDCKPVREGELRWLVHNLRTAVTALETERDGLKEERDVAVECHEDATRKYMDFIKQRDEAVGLLGELVPVIEKAIEATPTGDKRNALCDLNIRAQDMTNGKNYKPTVPASEITELLDQVVLHATGGIDFEEIKRSGKVPVVTVYADQLRSALGTLERRHDALEVHLSNVNIATGRPQFSSRAPVSFVRDIIKERDDLREKCKIFCNPDGVVATKMVTIKAQRDDAVGLLRVWLVYFDKATIDGDQVARTRAMTKEGDDATTGTD